MNAACVCSADTAIACFKQNVGVVDAHNMSAGPSKHVTAEHDMHMSNMQT